MTGSAGNLFVPTALILPIWDVFGAVSPRCCACIPGTADTSRIVAKSCNKWRLMATPFYARTAHLVKGSEKKYERAILQGQDLLQPSRRGVLNYSSLRCFVLRPMSAFLSH